jgi:hypothetical protein
MDEITANSTQKAPESKQEKPNESTGIYVRGHLKITDPETGQVYVNKGN